MKQMLYQFIWNAILVLEREEREIVISIIYFLLNIMIIIP